MKWSNFESLLHNYPNDRHVWHYAKGMLHPLVISLENRLNADLEQQEKHEEAVQRYMDNLDLKKKEGFVRLSKKNTSKWGVIEKFVFMRGFLERDSITEQVIEYSKLLQMIGIVWIVPLMCALDTGTSYLNYVLAILTMFGFILTYIDWHSPYWQPDTGVIVTSPPMIFQNWLRIWALQHFIMKFPFDIFFMWSQTLGVVMTSVRFLKIFNFAAVITKFARLKEKRTLHFGLVMQVCKWKGDGLNLPLTIKPSI